MGDTAEKIPLNTGGAKPNYNGNNVIERGGADSLRPEKWGNAAEVFKSKLDGTALIVGPSGAVDDVEGAPSASASASAKVTVLPLEDVVGCEVVSEKVLVVHSYPRAVGCCGGGGGRRGHTATRFVGSPEALAFFHHEILFAVRCGVVGSGGRAVPIRDVLVLVNPCSGAGLAPKLFKDEVEPVLKHAQIAYHLHVTTCQGDGERLVQRVKLGAREGASVRAGAGGDHRDDGVGNAVGEAASTSAAATSETHSEAKTSAGAGDDAMSAAADAEAARVAREHAAAAAAATTGLSSSSSSSSLEGRRFDTVLVVSGDGLLYEAVQGIMSRPDWREAIQVSLCIAPGGSANGLSMSVLHRCGEAYGGLESAFVCAKGVPMPFDISSTFSGPGMSKHTYGFLGLSWGIIADVDIGSESLRWMGGLRMTVGAIAAICTFRTYPGEFWYLPIENTPTVAPVDVAAAGAVGAGKGKEKGEEEGKGGGGEGDAQVVGAGAEEGEDGGDGNSSGGSSSSGSAVVGRPALRCLPANGGAVEPREEDGWKCIQCEDHLLWWAMQITHGSYDNYTAPGAVFDDGCFHVLIGDSSPGRCGALCDFLKMEDGQHVGYPNSNVKIIKCSAFKLCPGQSPVNSYLTVDGEVIDYGDIQAEVHRGLARLLMLPAGMRER